MLASNTLFGFPAESVVQLANVGCGAVCVLGVLISGTMIVKFDRKDSATKASLITRFMQMCIVLSVISGLSSWHLAQNNAAKVEVAEKKTEDVSAKTRDLLAKVDETQKAITPPPSNPATPVPPNHPSRVLSPEVMKHFAELEHSSKLAREAVQK
jgi:hypothetical protein